MFKNKMGKLEKVKLILLALIISSFFGTVSQAQAASPVLYFSDLTDGPVSGWNGSPTKGAAVSIWGNNFGSSRGNSYVTIGGVNLTNDSDYAEWGATTNPTTARGLERITFWLNSDMTLGDTTITVTTSDGTSQAIPFYTRNTGHIYFVSPSGDNGNVGSLSAPIKTLAHIKNIMQTGDTFYFRAGIYTDLDIGSTHNTMMDLSTGLGTYNTGAVNNSIGFASYPAEVAQFSDGRTAIQSVFRQYGSSSGDAQHFDHVVWSKFKAVLDDTFIEMPTSANTTMSHVRFVGLDATTVSASIGHGILFTISANSGSDDVRFLGNYLHHVGKVNENDPHGYKVSAIYVMGFGHHGTIEEGWNEFAHNNGTEQHYGHFTGDSLDHLIFHDNYVHDNGTSLIVAGGGDPTNGSEYDFLKVADIYNNIFANCKGAARFSDDGSKGGHGGIYHVYNNIFYNSTASRIFTIGDLGALTFRNNIILTYYGADYAVYFGQGEQHSTGSNNTYYGLNGVGILSWDDSNTSSVVEPKFINPTNGDFHLQSTSPARNAGTTISLVTHDFDGLTRPQGSAYDIGAYEFVESSGTEIRADVDQNSTINSTDAMLTLRNSLGLDMSSTNWQASSTTGDVNCDDDSNSTDAMLILRKSLGLDMSGTGWCID